jgi:hypothetical protein
MYLHTILWEISCIRIRQRKILKALRENGILDWDGYIPIDDQEATEVLKEIQETIRLDNADPPEISGTDTAKSP